MCQLDISYLFGSGAIDIWLQGGCPPEKLIMGMGMYGRSFKLASWAPKDPKPGSPVQGFQIQARTAEGVQEGSKTLIGRLTCLEYKGE
jgi:GH18 family chitinase